MAITVRNRLYQCAVGFGNWMKESAVSATDAMTAATAPWPANRANITPAWSSPIAASG